MVSKKKTEALAQSTLENETPELENEALEVENEAPELENESLEVENEALMEKTSFCILFQLC